MAEIILSEKRGYYNKRIGSNLPIKNRIRFSKLFFLSRILYYCADENVDVGRYFQLNVKYFYAGDIQYASVITCAVNFCCKLRVWIRTDHAYSTSSDFHFQTNVVVIAVKNFMTIPLAGDCHE